MMYTKFSLKTAYLLLIISSVLVWKLFIFFSEYDEPYIIFLESSDREAKSNNRIKIYLQNELIGFVGEKILRRNWVASEKTRFYPFTIGARDELDESTTFLIRQDFPLVFKEGEKLLKVKKIRSTGRNHQNSIEIVVLN